MRRDLSCLLSLPVLLLWAGCGSELLPPDSGVLDTVAEWGAGDANSAPPELAAAPTPAGQSVRAVSGSVFGPGNYQVFDLGPGEFGDEWTVSTANWSSALVVVLFEADYDLLMRARPTVAHPLRHITRADAAHVYLGVMPLAGSDGGEFHFEIARAAGAAVPPPRRQVVYLDFGPGHDIVVHRRAPISFPAFSGEMLGTAYAEHTQIVKDVIVQTMREDYAPYDVVLHTSDDGPPPTDVACSTVHFGGEGGNLLGLADNVDMYNADQQQSAVIYVVNFGNYQAMELEPDEMGVMIGNVASHELGHLLGLYHTKDPDEVMDSTGSAWDLAGAQSFMRGPLEDTVFATGMQNTPRLLEQTVGLRAEPAAASSKVLGTARQLRYKQIRGFMMGEIRCRCGLCLNPDQ